MSVDQPYVRARAVGDREAKLVRRFINQSKRDKR
jgi:hypothetical protein